MSKVSLVEKRFFHGVANAVYAVETSKAGVVYMRIDRTNYNNDQRAVVIVDADLFLIACRAFPYHQEPVFFMEERGWREDYKFELAEKGFSHGIDNPVPLADVGVHVSDANEKRTSVGFTNGITRTIWLLANGAAAFPVKCDMNQADALNKAVGLKGSEVYSVEDLLGQMSVGV